jgi:RNase P subunit RPR2
MPIKRYTCRACEVYGHKTVERYRASDNVGLHGHLCESCGKTLPYDFLERHYKDLDDE